VSILVLCLVWNCRVHRVLVLLWSGKPEVTDFYDYLLLSGYFQNHDHKAVLTG